MAVNTWARLRTRATVARAAGEEEQAHAKLDMTRRELGDLEKRWKAVEREAGQGERDMKEMQAEVESLWKKADRTGYSAETEQASEALRRAKDDAMHCIQVRVCPLLHV